MHLTRALLQYLPELPIRIKWNAFLRYILDVLVECSGVVRSAPLTHKGGMECTSFYSTLLYVSRSFCQAALSVRVALRVEGSVAYNLAPWGCVDCTSLYPTLFIFLKYSKAEWSDLFSIVIHYS